MTTSPYHIASLLDKMTSSDKDFRFMATNDLMAELQKDSIKLDDESERKVVQMLLKLLEDKNGEVQNLAVKCLGPLVGKVKEYHVETIVDTLCSNMLSDNEQLRDISSIGLKTVIGELPPASSSLAANICRRITGRLTNAIAKSTDVSVQLEALDILGDLLSRFGGLLVSYHPSIQASLLPQLKSARLAVRKRAIIALGHLVLSANSSLFVELMDHLLNELQLNTAHSTTRTFIQCIGAICRQAGHKVGEHLERIIPFIVKYSQVPDDDELKEYCIQAFESFVQRCPKEVTPFIPKIIELCLKFICYDPNYNYGDDADENMETDQEEEEEDDDDDEYSDDDDMSWKVRRAAAKCLTAIVGSRHELLSDLYKTIAPALIARFKEREENVKADIFTAYITLLRQTRPVAGQVVDADSMDEDSGPLMMLQNQIGNVVKALHKQLKEKSVKTRQGCFHVMSELVAVLPGALSEHISAIVPGIQFSLTDKSSTSNMKIDTLAFLGCILSQHPPHVFHPHILVLVPPVVQAIGDPFYKITSEALLVTQQLVKVIRPLDVKSSFDYSPYVKDIYNSTLMRLKAADIDQEVKERAISCMGQILHSLGDELEPELPTCLPIFLDRLRNEITRLTTVKAYTLIAGSPLKVNLSSILNESMPILASFLRKNQRALKLSTLNTLNVLMNNYGTSLVPDNIAGVLAEVPPLINESDLHISQLTLSLLTSTAKVHTDSMAKASATTLPAVMELVKSPLLQGGALNAMLTLLTGLVNSGIKGMAFSNLFEMLVLPIYAPQGSQHLHKQAYYSIAKCVAALTISCPNDGELVVNTFVKDIQSSKVLDAVRLFSLLSLGEIGKHVDLSSHKDLAAAILNCFSSPSEEIKSAASFALGKITAGNLTLYLPFLLKEIEQSPKKQYLLLHSLKEVISCEACTSAGIQALRPFIESIWALLFSHCESTEEGTRNVVAECLGKLTLVDPVTLLPQLQKYLDSGSAFARSTVVTAVKFTISDQPQPIDVQLKACIGQFLRTVQDADLNVRRVALVAFNSAAHNKPSLIRDLLDSILPQLYNETKIRKELIREVEMGPFKHTVDDGLDIRKAAFECMYTLLDTCLDRLDIFEFLNHVEDGLKDHYDIKMLTFLMLVRLASLCPTAVLQRVDILVEPLRQTLQTKVKANSVKQEFEKQDELKRSALRAVVALLSIQDSDKSPLLNDFLAQIKSSPELSAMFDAIQKDSGSSEAMDIS
ncbi:cullin-associated NEDD8-dissociated protein 1-like isoform X2 [Actinia tenebrosa]|uniref:Cullin-associated NEDD8-dissociated protein 1-like isoform X1 n=1 Tax=Actinia tenebrosa TaxID=6105 RepID=A0A6P8I7D8_ACTTE|nr:cullin-associated NEDD8-dissociated protein 1-like isoform X1 [Actinia tenebrosa]XP_031563226.1 cullin-associated NEDD8-dissociated protein 1-like isoform X2 [Actinia tenebrosa]